jgi:hypothetical protein
MEVKAIDRANCVFAYQDNVFHLNNVHVDRINIQGWKNAVEQWTEVELHGDDVVVEHTYASTEPRPTKPVAYKQWKLNLKTHEVDRVSRAWQYIYSNGCIGKKSPF